MDNKTIFGLIIIGLVVILLYEVAHVIESIRDDIKHGVTRFRIGWNVVLEYEYIYPTIDMALDTKTEIEEFIKKNGLLYTDDAWKIINRLIATSERKMWVEASIPNIKIIRYGRKYILSLPKPIDIERR